MSLICDKRSKVWDTEDIAHCPWVWGWQKCQSGSQLFCSKSNFMFLMVLNPPNAEHSLLCPLVSSNTWRVTVTWPTDWKELWIINSWLIWFFWIGKALVCIGYSDLIFFSQRLESQMPWNDFISFTQWTAVFCLSALLYPNSIRSVDKPTALTASEKVLLSSSCLKQNLFANKQGVVNSVHKKHCSVQWGAPPICLSKCN